MFVDLYFIPGCFLAFRSSLTHSFYMPCAPQGAGVDVVNEMKMCLHGAYFLVRQERA